jgi:hypothetical protein
MKKKNLSTILLISSLALFLVVGSAMASPVLDFRDGFAVGIGSITYDGNNVTGTGIGLDQLFAGGVSNFGIYDLDGSINGPYSSAASLDFNTATNIITITGSIPGASVGPQTLLTGSFSSWTWDNTNLVFSAIGFDTKCDAILNFFGIGTETPFNYATFTLGWNFSGSDIVPVSVDLRNTPVPIPATMWIFGAGLVGLVGIRRKLRS